MKAKSEASIYIVLTDPTCIRTNVILSQDAERSMYRCTPTKQFVCIFARAVFFYFFFSSSSCSSFTIVWIFISVWYFNIGSYYILSTKHLSIPCFLYIACRPVYCALTQTGIHTTYVYTLYIVHIYSSRYVLCSILTLDWFSNESYL